MPLLVIHLSTINNQQSITISNNNNKLKIVSLLYFLFFFSFFFYEMTISTGLANLVCIGFTVIYVIGFYLFKTPGSRNHPSVIRARMKAVTVASFISMFIVQQLTPSNLFTILGLVPVLSAVKPVFLTILLFLGPLSTMYFENELPFQTNFNLKRDVVESFTTPLGQRNYFVVFIVSFFAHGF